MFPSLNLRFDLAKLNEAELMQRVDEAWGSYHAAGAEKQPWIELRNSWNGPIHHPRPLWRCKIAEEGLN